MRFCKYCGSQVEDGALTCPQCSRELPAPKPAPAPQPAPVPQAAPVVQPVAQKPSAAAFFTEEKKAAVLSWLKKPVVWGVLAVLAVVIVIFSLGDGKCDYGSCSNKAVSGSDYCYSHKCAFSDCDRSAYVYSNYCYSHYLIYDDDATTSNSYVPSYQLKISNVEVYSSSNYTYAEGTITNNSNTTVSFVKIKGSFETSYGTVVDTDWTYAVGSEGLAPGETCKWKMSVEKDSSIRDCEITILDYDYD